MAVVLDLCTYIMLQNQCRTNKQKTKKNIYFIEIKSLAVIATLNIDSHPSTVIDNITLLFTLMLLFKIITGLQTDITNLFI